jgi:hypothetical protein
MDDDTKKQATEYVMGETKTRNYRKHMSDELMNLIVRDVLTAMAKWEGPDVSLDSKYEDDQERTSIQKNDPDPFWDSKPESKE